MSSDFRVMDSLGKQDIHGLLVFIDVGPKVIY